MVTPPPATLRTIVPPRALALCASLLAPSALGAGGCAGDAASPAPAPAVADADADADGCARGEIEADLVDADGAPLAGRTGLQGPGVDPVTGALAPGRYVFSSTYVRLARTAAARDRLFELSAPVLDEVASTPGVVALALGVSGACATARTFVAWESPEAMYALVASEAHRAAAGALGDMSRGGGAATHWSGDETDATWARGAEALAAAPPFD